MTPSLPVSGWRTGSSFGPRAARRCAASCASAAWAAETVEAALVDLDPEAGAYEAGYPRAVRLAALAQTDPLAFRRKLGDFLLRRGFGYEIVKQIVARLLRKCKTLLSSPGRAATPAETQGVR